MRNLVIGIVAAITIACAHARAQNAIQATAPATEAAPSIARFSVGQIWKAEQRCKPTEGVTLTVEAVHEDGALANVSAIATCWGASRWSHNNKLTGTLRLRGDKVWLSLWFALPGLASMENLPGSVMYSDGKMLLVFGLLEPAIMKMARERSLVSGGLVFKE